MLTETDSSLNSIYKVNYLINGVIDTTYVFYGKPVIKQDQSEILKKIFTKDEIRNIKNIHFSEQQIHYDDSIGVIKLKILNELNKLNKSVSLGEIYLFCQKLESLNAVLIYQLLTQNTKINLTSLRLDQFITNIVKNENGVEFVKPPKKDEYDLDDILNMKLGEQKFIIDKVLGQQFFIENEYPFVCNPFKVTNYDEFFEKMARKSLSTLNNNLLLNTGPILNNNIYLCLAKDVLNYDITNEISEKNTIKIYYPFLYIKNINSLENLTVSSSKLLQENTKILNDKTENTFKTVDMFYDIFKSKKTELKYVKSGIKYIKAVLKPTFTVKIPLEVIFKIIHATKDNPLIKYNPASRQENIYRLYTEQIASDGKKIPYLKKGTIFKLVKNIGKTKSVTVFIEHTSENNETLNILCEFDENGYITISSEFEKGMNEADINTLFQQTINPIIQEITNFLEQSGYKLNKFNSLNDPTIEIEQLTYISQIKVSKPINLGKIKGCVSRIFNNESNPKKPNIILLRFKRVANFNKVTSQEAFIIEKQSEGYRGEDIIKELLINFPDDLTRQTAIELVNKIANEIEIARGVKKDIKIKDNPGFKTTITLEKSTGIITIIVENINNINYLLTIPIYLDTMIRLTQDKNSTRYPIKEIDNLCSEEDDTDIAIPDISSSSESQHFEKSEQLDQEEEDQEDTKYIKNKINKNKKTAYELFFNQEDEEEEEPSQGGANSSSEKSVSSEKSISSVKSIPSEKSISSAEDTIIPSVKSIQSPEEKSISSLVPSVKSSSSTEDKSVPIAEEKSSSSAEEKSSSSDKSISSDKSLSELESLKSTTKQEESLKPITEQEIKSPSESTTPAVALQEKLAEHEEEPSQEKKSEGKIVNEEISSVEPEAEAEPEPEALQEKIVKQDIIESKKEISKPELIIEEDSSSKSKSKSNSDSVSDSDSGSDSESDTEEKINTNIDGMSLRNYFQDKIEKRDAPLIIKKEIGNYSAYSKVCQSQHKRQPVILTDAELKKINNEHKGFLRDEDVIKYGSDKNNKFNYICPRYWCLKTNSPIEPGEFKEITENGKKVLVHPTCGRILPEGKKGKEDKIIPGHYVYEFYKPTADKPDYKRYPGFQTDKHPKGFCLPCCFDKYNTVGRITSNQKCTADSKDDDKKEQKETPPEKNKKQKDQDEYVKGPEKFPLPPERWGYLPVPIQKMLHEVNADCQISKTNTNVKQNHPCLLRHGVEISETQSFVACISDALFFATKILDSNNKPTNNLAEILSIRKMKELIIKSLTIDNFIKYQNGNLVTDFYDPTKTISMDKIDVKYSQNVKLYTKLNMSVEVDKLYYTKVVSAFENFINFLKDDDSVIDYVYLWDIICSPNKYLFGTSGINLVIFEIPDDDITNNVQMICPSNHYSTEFYEARKPTLFLMKKDNYYEPIYSYTINNKKIGVTKFFSEYNTQQSNNTMKAVFNEIVKPFLEMCRPLPSMPPGGLPPPNVYLAKTPLLLYNLVQKLDKYNYTISKLVVNFNSKVIGVVAESPQQQKGFIPCYPSAIDEKLKLGLDYVFMTDLDLWSTYDKTIDFLRTLEKRSKKKRPSADIPCKPAFKVMEDELIVGILTETNQFIQLSEPISENDINPDNNIPSFKNSNYIVNSKSRPMVSSDVPITTSDKVDEERVDFIKKIKLETNFYNVFRNTIRILLNDYENNRLRKQIETEMLKEYIIYSQKLKNITALLRELVNDKIQFTGDDNYYKLINEVSSCIVKDANSCGQTNLCAVTENGKCKLILPTKNLITQKINEPMYFGKMADELIRYNRIKSFMLQPKVYLSFGNIGYNLRENEIIMIQSLLTQEYFENLLPSAINKYVTNNSYDEAAPLISQTYDNVVPSLDHAIGRNNDAQTCTKIYQPITSSMWNKCFPDNFREVKYNKINYCTFIFMIDLIEKKTGNKLTVHQFKNELYDEYKKYLENYKERITDILILEGKKTLGDQVKTEVLSFINFIYTHNYFLTTFDIWLIVQKYKIPTIFISQTKILQTNKKDNIFVGYGTATDEFIFIIIPGLRAANVPGFKYVESDKGDCFISLDKIKNDTCKAQIMDAIDKQSSVEIYLDNFSKSNFIKTKLIIDDDSDDEIIVPEPKRPLIIEEDSDEEPQLDIKVCPEGKELNPKTNRCINIKKPKNNTKKNKNDVVEPEPTNIKVCPEGKELNPKTNRCVNIKKPKNNTKKNKTTAI
jgi:hypothetical protein